MIQPPVPQRRRLVKTVCKHNLSQVGRYAAEGPSIGTGLFMVKGRQARLVT